ncbi:MAG: hypothetical protein HY369_01180 [Candidatus Aenigmarchaeota archaeon]|nr:hypothetical protein [Candidatus Aenigmarchaeota archaeon]
MELRRHAFLLVVLVAGGVVAWSLSSPFDGLPAVPTGQFFLGNPAAPQTPAPVPACDPPVAQGSISDVYLAHEQFLNHKLYWPCAPEENCNEGPAKMAQNQLDWTEQGLANYWAAQFYLVALDPDPVGNYCLYSAPFGSTSLYWPVAVPPGGCGGYTSVYIPPKKYATVVEAFGDMDCVQTFLRSFLS